MDNIEDITANGAEGFIAEDDLAEERTRLSDIAAVQTAVCIFAAVVLVCIDIAMPDTGKGLVSLLRELSSAADELIPNPVSWLFEYLGQL
ncbi:MAG: hypothetical protein IJ874_04845 [Ruminococcus sp.]|nr:hypothetical protein [Ruminococcus sp.]